MKCWEGSAMIGLFPGQGVLTGGGREARETFSEITSTGKPDEPGAIATTSTGTWSGAAAFAALTGPMYVGVAVGGRIPHTYRALRPMRRPGKGGATSKGSLSGGHTPFVCC